MKLYTCLAHIDLSKLAYLRQVLYSQQLLFEEVHVAIVTNKINSIEINEILSVAPENTHRFQVEVINRDYDKLPSAWLLPWVHKVLMYEKFQDTTYTHFLNIEDDIEVTPKNIDYWLRAREDLRPYRLFPSFFRVEWSEGQQDWVSVDALQGDQFSVDRLPHVMKSLDYGYVNLPRTYQGMFLYDRELMGEYISSGNYAIDEAFPHWRYAIQFEDSPLGLGEASHFGLSEVGVPSGCMSRNFLPFFAKYNMLDPSCFVHHLHNKYANISTSPHGKVLLSDLLAS